MTKDKVTLFDAQGNEIDTEQKDVRLDPTFLRGSLFTSKFDTTEYDRRTYENHSWTYACVSAIVNNLSAPPRVLTDKQGSDDFIEEHPILDLFLRPNPLMSGTEFWEAVYLNLLLPTLNTPGGQCFIIPAFMNDDRRPNFRKGDLPDYLFPFSDRYILPISDKITHQIVGWKLELPEGKPLNFTNEEILRIRLMNPYDPSKGLSPWSASRIAVSQDNKSDVYNTEYYNNSGAIGGLLTTEQELNGKQQRMIAKKWDENFSGAGNIGKTAVLGKGVKYEQYVRTNVDMQFIQQREENRKRIQAVYGVPDSEIAIFESGMNRATAETASRNFWKKTLLPYDKKVTSAINILWVKFIDGGRFRLKTDKSDIEALKDDLTQSIDNAEKLVKMSVPPAEACRVLDIPVDTKKYGWLEESFINSLLVPASTYGTVTPPGKTPTSDGNGKAKEDDKDKHILTPIKTMLDNSFGKVQKEIERSEERDELSNSYIRDVLLIGEGKFRGEVEKFMHKLKREVLDNIDSWLKEQTKNYVRQVVIDPVKFLFNIDNANKDLVDIYSPAAQDQIERETARIEKELGELVNWKVTPEYIDSVIKRRSKILKTINSTTFGMYRNKITDTVHEGLENNWTPQELAKELKERINVLGKARANQALTIARTEIGTISSMARFDAFEVEKIEEIEWLSSRDELVRNPANGSKYDHSIDEEVIERGQFFSNYLRYPRDPGGASGNVINCRCVFIKHVPK